ncbi:MAG: hypothetical protein AB7S72_11895 [Draconibacterium sp.]
MDFEQIFENRKYRYNNQGKFNYNNAGYPYHSSKGYDKHYRQKAFLRNIFSNRKLRVAIIVGFVIVLFILIALIALLFPLISNLFNYILENGISGLLGEAGKLLETIWTGSK